MISNQILQNTIDGLKGITRIDLCVLDMEGQTLASTEAQPENFGGEVAAFISSPACLLVTLLSHSCEEKYFKNCVRSKVLTPFGSFTFRIPLNWLMVSIPLRSIHKLRKRMYSSMMVAEF